MNNEAKEMVIIRKVLSPLSLNKLVSDITFNSASQGLISKLLSIIIINL